MKKERGRCKPSHNLISKPSINNTINKKIVNVELMGEYERVEDKLIKEDITILIKHREKYSKEKPKFYLYMVSPIKGYISSLYHKRQGYIIEYKGRYYRIVKRGDKVAIEREEKRGNGVRQKRVITPKYINKELVQDFCTGYKVKRGQK